MTHAHVAEKHITQSDLCRRGWTKPLIAKHLGAPDVEKPNPYYRNAGAPMKLYLLNRVERAEQSPEFRADVNAAAARRDGAAAAVETKRTNLLAAVESFPIDVQVVPDVTDRAIRSYNGQRQTGASRAAHPDSDAAFLRRITVNYIRHHLTVYDRALDEVAGRVGVGAAAQRIKARIYAAIAKAYPELTNECRDQMSRRGATAAVLSVLPPRRPEA